MAVVTILSESVRGSLVTPEFSIPAGSPKFIRLAMTSPTFATDSTLHWDIAAEQSFDNGTIWQSYFTSTNVGGGGLAVQGVRWDGTACLLRVNITVPIPFTWGVTGEILVL